MNLQGPPSVFLAGLAVHMVVRANHQLRQRGKEFAVRRYSTSDGLLILFVVIGQVILPDIYMCTSWLNLANHRMPASFVGLGVLAWLAGLWVFWRSHADPGRHRSVSRELKSDHRLVTDGVYRRVRHPMYSSFLLLGAGQALLLPNRLAGFSALVAVALLCVVRVPHEEAMMRGHFGQDSRDYMARTGSVVPRTGLHRGV